MTIIDPWYFYHHHAIQELWYSVHIYWPTHKLNLANYRVLAIILISVNTLMHIGEVPCIGQNGWRKDVSSMFGIMSVDHMEWPWFVVSNSCCYFSCYQYCLFMASCCTSCTLACSVLVAGWLCSSACFPFIVAFST